MAYLYSTVAGENCAKAVGMSLPISRKKSIVVCQFIRGKSLQKAKKMLTEVINLAKAVPFTRYPNGPGHKPGMAAGRYPAKTCAHILGLLESAEANAQFKGLSTADLIVKHITTQQGPKTWHYGRQSRRRIKRNHVEIVLEERKVKKEGKK